jgi:hypothetical protein
LLDRGAELVVFDAADRALELRTERCRRGHLPILPALGDPLDDVDRTDAESERLHVETTLRQPRDQLRCEHRQLVRPHARRDLDDEDLSLERDRPRAIGDPRADGRTPFGERDRQRLLREAMLAHALQDLVERLRRLEASALPSFPAPHCSFACAPSFA